MTGAHSSGGTHRHDFELDAPTVAPIRSAAKTAGVGVRQWLAASFAAVLGRYADVDEVSFHIDGACSRLSGLASATLAELAGQLVEQPDPTTQHSVLRLDCGPVSDTGTTLPGGLSVELGPFTDEDRIAGIIRYQEELGEEWFGRRLAGHLGTLAADGAAAPKTPVGELRLLTDAEYRQIVHQWNDTADPALPLDRCLIQLFAEQVARRPEAPAVSLGTQTTSYARLNQLSDQVAAGLRAAEAAAGSAVAILMPRGPLFIAAMLGAFKAGVAFVTLDTRQPLPALAPTLSRSGATVLLTVADLAAAAAELVELAGPGTRSVLTVDAEAPDVPASTGECCRPVDLAYLMFTSGSTGAPKGAGVQHRGMVNHMFGKITDLGIDGADVIAQTGPPCFDIVVWQCLAGLLRGARVHVIPDELAVDPNGLLDELDRSGVTVLQIVPAMLKTVLLANRSRPPALSGLRWLVPTGDALPAELCQQWFALHPDIPILNTYGSTECSDDQCHLVLRQPPPSVPAVVPIGRPIANMTTYVLDSALRPRPIGLPGELFIGGIGVGLGYLDQPELTSEKFIADPFADGRLYRTGDLVRYREDGVLEFLDRIDRTAKIRGYRIELAEIDAVLSHYPGVLDSVVVAWRAASDLTDARLCGYLVLAPGEQLQPAALREFCADRLPAHMIPAAFTVLDRLPLNASGKVDANRLPEPDWSARRADGGYLPPANDTERLVAELWTEVLGLPSIGGTDDFFALGGHSLSAMHFLRLLEDRTGRRVPLRAVFDNPSVIELARLVDGTAPSVARPQRALPQPGQDDGTPFGLTDLQQAYWVGQSAEFALGGLNAHLFLELALPELDVGRAEAALRRLVAEHAVLRVIVQADGRQRVLDQVPPAEILRTDLRSLSWTAAEAALAQARADRGVNGPATDSWPLFEVAAFVLPDRTYRLQISVSLQLLDAYSEHLLLRDWLRFYADPTADRPRSTLDYRDYVEHIGQLEHQPADSADWAYWRERLAGLPPAPDLPLAADLAAVTRPSFSRRSVTLPASAWAAFKQRAAGYGVTPSAALFTAYVEVLARWSKEPRFTVNSLASHRLLSDPEFAEVAGNFGSTLPVDADCSGPVDFATRAARLQAQLLDDLDHASVSGVAIVREAARLHGWSGRAVLPVVFASTLDVDTAFLDELPFPAAVSCSGLQTPQVYLDHQVYSYRGCLVANWDVVDEVVGSELAERMWQDYCRLLRLLAESDQSWTAVARRLLTDLQAPAPVIGATDGLLHEPFLRQAAERPAATAVIAPHRTLSYHELERRSALVATQLRQAGVQPGALVPVVMEKGWQQVVAVLGVLRAGAAYLPLDPSLPPARLHYLMGMADRLALTQPWLLSSIDWPEHTAVLPVEDEPVADAGAVAEPVRVAPNGLAYVIYTSGSTGLPKGVAVEHGAAMNTIDAVNRRTGLGPDDRVFAISSLSFDLSVWDIFGTLAAGAAVVLPAAASAREPADWAALIDRAGVTVWNSVPALLEMLVAYAEDHASDALRRLRVAMASGDWIPVSLPDRLRRQDPEVQMISLGGATEASIWSIWYPIEEVEPSWRSIPYGKAMPGQSFHVLDEQLEPRPIGVIGELYIGGAGLARCYWRDEAQTAARFVRHPRTGVRLYRTGDLGRQLPDGNIEFLGRNDDQVKVHGYRVEPGEIEAALLRLDGIREAAVVARGGGEQGKALVAYYVADGALSGAEIRRLLADQLPSYLVPTAYMPLSEVPLSANGKVDRKALPEPGSTLPAGPARPLVGAVESYVAELFGQILDREVTDSKADFFALGGTSFGALRLVSGLELRFDRRISLSALFDGASVAKVAELVGAGSADQHTALVPIATGAAGPPLVLIHPVGGNLLCYSELLAALDYPGPVYGCQSAGLSSPAERDSSIEQMAERYVAELLSTVAAPTIRLAGWSMGGVLAVAMARLLGQHGREVDRVVLIDAEPASEAVHQDGEEYWIGRFLADLLGESEAVADTDVETALRRAGLLSPTGGIEELAGLLAVFKANTLALHRHQTTDYAGPVLLIRAAESAEDNAERWRQYLPELAVAEVEAGHYTMMTGSRVREMANIIGEFFDTAGLTERIR